MASPDKKPSSATPRPQFMPAGAAIVAATTPAPPARHPPNPMPISLACKACAAFSSRAARPHLGR